MKRSIIWVLAALVLFAFLPDLVQAQENLPNPNALANQNLRGYTHMFIAYFIAWALILGWVISIARRLGRVEKALNN